MPAIELGTYLRPESQKYHDCIEACVACLVACEMCSDACLHESDVAMVIECIRLDRDCAEACVAALRAMARWPARRGVVSLVCRGLRRMRRRVREARVTHGSLPPLRGRVSQVRRSMQKDAA